MKKILVKITASDNEQMAYGYCSILENFANLTGQGKATSGSTRYEYFTFGGAKRFCFWYAYNTFCFGVCPVNDTDATEVYGASRNLGWYTGVCYAIFFVDDNNNLVGGTMPIQYSGDDFAWFWLFDDYNNTKCLVANGSAVYTAENVPQSFTVEKRYIEEYMLESDAKVYMEDMTFGNIQGASELPRIIANNALGTQSLNRPGGLIITVDGEYFMQFNNLFWGRFDTTEERRINVTGNW